MIDKNYLIQYVWYLREKTERYNLKIFSKMLKLVVRRFSFCTGNHIILQNWCVFGIQIKRNIQSLCFYLYIQNLLNISIIHSKYFHRHIFCSMVMPGLAISANRASRTVFTMIMTCLCTTDNLVLVDYLSAAFCTAGMGMIFGE